MNQWICGGGTPLRLGESGRANGLFIWPALSFYVSAVINLEVSLMEVVMGVVTYCVRVGGIVAWSLSLGGSFQ